MKKILFLFGLFTLLATVSFAQDRTGARVKPAKTSSWRDDSLLWVKKPIDKNATIKSPDHATARQNRNEDKLGNFEIQDKNPKVVSPRDAASGQATGRRTHKPLHGGKPNN